MRTRFCRLGLILGITAALAAAINYRSSRAGEWLPALPWILNETWAATDTPMNEGTLTLLGSPRTIQRIYRNPFDDEVSVSVIAASNIDAYHEPAICMYGSGYHLTAERLWPVDGPGHAVRAMVFRRDDDQRVLMYYWLQSSDGSTYAEPVQRTRSILPRFESNLRQIITGRQVCIVRIIAAVPGDDSRGARTRRNVEGIARAACAAMRPVR